MSVDYLDKGNDDGTNFGYATTSKIGFYGLATPIVQPTVTLTTSATGATTAVLLKLQVDVMAICSALQNLGLIG